MAINNYTDADFMQLQADHAQLKSDFKVAQSQNATLSAAFQKDLDKMESKFDREMVAMRSEIKEVNGKIDLLLELANQAKGAEKMAKIMWVVGAALAGVFGWAAKGFIHLP